MAAWNRQRWLLAILVAVTAISTSGAQQIQTSAYFVTCFTTTSIDFVPVPNEAPLGSYDFRSALFPAPTQRAGAAPIQTGLQCSALCRRSGRPLSGLTRNLEENGNYSCFCGVAWRGFPSTVVNFTGAECGPCASNNASQCPANDASLAVYYHRPVYDPVTIQYQNCHNFPSSLQRSITATEQGLAASFIGGGILVTEQATTCIAECSLHGFSLSGVAGSNQCWCFNDFTTASTFTCSAGACLIFTLVDSLPVGTHDQLICGGIDQVALYGTVAHRAPTVTTTPADGTVLSRTVGDATDMFACTAEINSIYMPLLVVWTLGGGAGTNLTSPQLGTLSADSNVSTVSESGYDGGIFSYTCVVRLPSDSSGSFPFVLSTITINVFSVPTGAVVESGIPILGTDRPGSTFTIQCANGGNGTAQNFRWSYPNGTSASSTDSLTITDPTAADEGNYTCHFSIQETGRNGTTMHEVRIYETPRVTLPSQRLQAIGDSLTCSEYVTNIGDRADVLSYSWLTPQGLVVGDVVTTTVTGPYMCTVTNSVLLTAGAGTSARGRSIVTVTAVEPPLANISITGVASSVVHRDSRNSARFVTLPGQSSVFNCTENTGAANVTYRWLRVVPGAAAEVVTTSSSFTLSDVGVPEDGQYQCEVTNPRIESSGRTTATTAIYDVFFSPEVMLTSAQYAIIDEAYSVACVVSGDLPDRYAWSRLDGEDAVLVTTNSTLSIGSAARSDTAMYRCNASGQAADTLPAYSSVGTVQLTVQAAPGASLSLGSPSSVVAGSSLEAICTASGETPASADITWERAGTVLASGGRLTIERNEVSLVLLISSVRRSDAGEYMCRVVDGSVGIPSRRTATAVLQVQTSGSDPQTAGSDSTPLIIGVVCGVVGLILLVVLIVIIYKQFQKKGKSNTGKDNPTYGEAQDSEDSSAPGVDEISSEPVSRVTVRPVPNTPGSSVSARYCESGPTPEETLTRHSFPPGPKADSKNTASNKLHCVSSAEVLTRVEEVEPAAAAPRKDSFPDTDEEPDYSDPTKRTSFALPAGEANSAFAVANATYAMQAAAVAASTARRSQAQPVSNAMYGMQQPMPAPEALYAQPDGIPATTGRSSKNGSSAAKSATLASYAHLSFNPQEPDSTLRAQVYEEPPDDEPTIYDRLAKQRCRQIAPEDIRMLEQLTYSHFGRVSRAEWTQGDVTRQVVAKQVNSDSSPELRTKLLQEGVIMGQFCHDNILRLHGIVLQGPAMMLIWEFMDKGVLNTVLGAMLPNSNEKPRRQAKMTLLGITRSIAAGMEYLAGKDFVHRDLAARNILIDSKHNCKIGNFNMSRDLANRDYYLSSSIGLSPQSTSKWLAPESLSCRQFSSASDVWSFGIVMYEIWTFGRSPYGAWSNQKVFERVTEGYRLSAPRHCPPSLAHIMALCWEEDRVERPTFPEIVRTLSVKDVCLL